MTQAEQVNSIAAFTPANTEGMEFAFDGSCHVWKQEPMDQKMRRGLSQGSHLDLNTMSTAPSASGQLGVGVMENNNDLQSAPQPAVESPPPALPIMDQQFENIMQHAEAAGFESFDSMVSSYYSHTFSDISPLAEEQRLSRNRRLPKVISDISRAADGWSSWERRGFHEEILKTAESMVITESAEARNNVLSQIYPLVEGHHEGMGQCSPEAVNAIKRAVQNDVSAFYWWSRIRSSLDFPESIGG